MSCIDAGRVRFQRRRCRRVRGTTETVPPSTAVWRSPARCSVLPTERLSSQTTDPLAVVLSPIKINEVGTAVLCNEEAVTRTTRTNAARIIHIVELDCGLFSPRLLILITRQKITRKLYRTVFQVKSSGTQSFDTSEDFHRFIRRQEHTYHE